MHTPDLLVIPMPTPVLLARLCYACGSVYVRARARVCVSACVCPCTHTSQPHTSLKHIAGVCSVLLACACDTPSSCTARRAAFGRSRASVAAPASCSATLTSPRAQPSLYDVLLFLADLPHSREVRQEAVHMLQLLPTATWIPSSLAEALAAPTAEQVRTRACAHVCA